MRFAKLRRIWFVSYSAVITLLTPTAAPADIGIAAAYPGDKNIASDPAVIFADDFESYTLPDQAKTRWGNGSGLVRMRIATESANVYSGSKAIEFSLPISTTEVSCSLWKGLSPEQDTVFMRMYQKFDSGYSVPTSNHNGIRLSAKYPEVAGTIPPADGTGFFLFLLQNAISKAGDTAPGESELYVYWPRQRSEWGDHWRSDGMVVPYSNTIGNQGEWLAYPAQYPDFKPMSNFTPQRDRWYCVEMMVHANTPGKNDGEVKYWIDGKVAGDFPNLNMRSISTLKIDHANMVLHAIHSERLNKKWHDNVVIATKYIGPMSGASPTPTPTGTPTPSPTPTPTPTPTGGGSADYLLFNASTRRTAVWNLQGTAFLGGAFGPTLPVGWTVVTTADVNGDGKFDLVLFNPSAQQTAVWYLDNTRFIGGALGPTIPRGWTLMRATDMDGDGHPDYVLFNSSTRQTAMWFLNNTTFARGAFGPTLPVGWSLADANDFNGDNKPDFVLTNATTRQTAFWYLNGTTFAGGSYGPTLPLGWMLRGTADINGDGKPDYILFNPAMGQTAVWYLSGGAVAGGAYGPTLPTGYTLVSP